MNNICFFNSIKFWGGGEKLQFENAIEFQNQGYNVYVAANSESPLWEKAALAGIKTLPIAVGNLSFLNPFKVIRLIRLYRKNKIDTVIFTTSQDVKLGSISAKLAGVKNMVYLRGLAVPIKAGLVNRIVFKWALTHIISNSEETKRKILMNLGKHIDESKVYTIYHGIDVEEYGKRKLSKLDEIAEKGHGVILGNAGRLTLQKGQDHLVEVARVLKSKNLDFTLFIAGTGELQDELQKKIDAFKLQDNVILLGFIEDMERFMSSLDIFLLSSTWEGFGFVLVEAMICSKPVVAFDITSNPEIVEVDKTGYLVEYPNADAFAEKVEQLIKDEGLRKSMGKLGKERVYERFVLKDRVSEIAELIRVGGLLEY